MLQIYNMVNELIIYILNYNILELQKLAYYHDRLKIVFFLNNLESCFMGVIPDVYS